MRALRTGESVLRSVTYGRGRANRIAACVNRGRASVEREVSREAGQRAEVGVAGDGGDAVTRGSRLNDVVVTDESTGIMIPAIGVACGAIGENRVANGGCGYCITLICCHPTAHGGGAIA